MSFAGGGAGKEALGRRAFTAWDGAVLAALLAGSCLLPWSWPQGNSAAAVELVSDEGERTVRLDAKQRIDVQGPLGITTVEVEPGGARVVSSPCPSQTCVRSGAVRLPGQVVACLPNRVVLRVAGAGKPDPRGVDAVAR
jgi:hypothetical protein